MSQLDIALVPPQADHSSLLKLQKLGNPKDTPKLENLSNYFLWAPDDSFFLKELDQNDYFNDTQVCGEHFWPF